MELLSLFSPYQDVPNSADPFMNLATAEIKSMLVEKYRRSAYARRAKTRIQELSTDVCLFMHI